MFVMFGVPVTCQSDNGSEFKGMVAELMLEKEVVYTHGQPYKPQSQGVIERFNQTIQHKLDSLMVQTGIKDWSLVLENAVIAYNQTQHSATKQSPYKILYGMDPPARQVTTSHYKHRNTNTNTNKNTHKKRKGETEGMAWTKSMLTRRMTC